MRTRSSTNEKALTQISGSSIDFIFFGSISKQ